MTSKARLELETSNRVLDGFLSDLVNSDVLNEDVRAEMRELAVTGNDSIHGDPGSTKSLDRARNKRNKIRNEPGSGASTDDVETSRAVVLGHPREYDQKKNDGYKKRSAIDLLPPDF